MIINCKCGKYQFDVKKSDVGTSGREVQCGICNEKWFHGGSISSSNVKKNNQVNSRIQGTINSQNNIFFYLCYCHNWFFRSN